MKIRCLLREPLLHFLLIGLLLFLLYGKVALQAADGNRITVNQTVIAALAGQFQATWSRPPTPGELNGLVDSYVRDEILFREGVALGLVKDDPVIKRRVRQKLEVLIEEEGKSGAPSDAELTAYPGMHAAEFRMPPVLSFQQVLFDPASYGDQLESALAASTAALNSGATAESQGRPSMLPSHVEKLPLNLVIRDFGDDFGKALESAPVGQWIGPIRSGFGVHLVRISERKPGYLPALDEARKAVTREWENDQSEAALAENYARLLKEYDVVIEGEDVEAPAQ
ncbi:MAG: peptidyl-prolyl cis-trans isomerase [Xanthomonadales bacterium]|nr:peptidyl-prolyl cis-trans isomerase [Xanthomonadales bacterium]